MNNPFQHVYNSSRWRKLRRLILCESPLCVACQKQGIVRPGQEVDHIISMQDGGLPFDIENLQVLCKECHSRKTLNEAQPRNPYLGSCGEDGWPTDSRHHVNGGNNKLSAEYQERVFPTGLKPSRIPLEIVCGPPGGGKSTYIRERATKDDLVIDLDQIMSSLSGLPEHMTMSKYLNPALEIRNNMLRDLATDRTHNKAYFIVSAADPTERRLWQEALGGKLVVIALPISTCIERIKADPARHGLHDRMIRKARDWWSLNKHMARPL